MTFTKEQIDVIVGTYEASKGGDYAERTKVVESLAKDYKVSKNVIQGKLVAEGVYVAKSADAKASTGTKTTKEDVCKAIEACYGIKIPSLRNMTKKDLDAFWARFVEMIDIDAAE